MSILDKQIRTARFRLTLNVALTGAALGLLVAASLWFMTVLVERFFVLGTPLGLAAAAAGLTGLVIALAAIHRGRIDALAAAVVLDEAAGLKERVSSALHCRSQSDPFARATLQDAEKIAGGIHVPTHVRYRAPRMWPWSVASVITALLFFQFMPPLNLFAADDAASDDESTSAAQREQQEIEVAMQAQMRKVEQRLEDKPALADMRKEISELEFPDKPTATPEDVRREAVKKIERVADKWKERLESNEMKSLDQLKRDLAKLETPKGDDQASKLTQALASGDMEAAKKALSDLKKSLEEAAQAGDADAKKQLADMQKKLDDLSKQLSKLAEAKKEQKLQKDLENKAGMSEDAAKKLLEQLDGKSLEEMKQELQKQLSESGMTQEQIEEMAKKIMQNQMAMQQLQQLAQSMAQACQACQQCQQGQQGQGMQSAQGAMESAMGQLSQLEMAQQMMNEMQAQIAELEQLKQGVGQGQCQRPGDPGDPNQIGGQGPQAGYGYGSRIGKQRGAHALEATKAGVRTAGGQIIGQMLIDGPQVRGEASAEATEAANSAVRDAEDAVEREEVPQQYQRAVQTYFEQLAGLLQQRRQTGTNSGDSEQKAESENSESKTGD